MQQYEESRKAEAEKVPKGRETAKAKDEDDHQVRLDQATADVRVLEHALKVCLFEQFKLLSDQQEQDLSVWQSLPIKLCRSEYVEYMTAVMRSKNIWTWQPNEEDMAKAGREFGAEAHKVYLKHGQFPAPQTIG